MRLCGFDDISLWCEKQGLAIGQDKRPKYRAADVWSLAVSLEIQPSHILGLCGQLVPTWSDAPPISEALFYLREREIWGEQSESIGAFLLKQLRSADESFEDLDLRPGCLFAGDEIVVIQSFLLLPMLFGWDAYLMFKGRNYFFFVSHDGYLQAVGTEQADRREIQRRIAGWNPQPGDPTNLISVHIRTD